MEEDVNLERFFELKESGKYDEAFDLLYPLRDSYAKEFEIQFLLGIVRYQAGRYSESVVFLKESLLLSPKNELSSLTLFHALIHLGKIHSALTELRRFLLTNPGKTNNHVLSIREMFENIRNFSTSEQEAINKLFHEFGNK